ncbi:MAG: SGNH/GDSL hydrolase family protein [Planctomycetota bacterium]
MSGKRDKVLKLLLAIVLASVVVLLAAEGVARLVAPPQPPLYVSHPLLGPSLAPNTVIERLSIDEPPVVFKLEMNPLGFRGKRMKETAKPKGAYRIFFLGASTVENILLPEERTFPGRVDDALAERVKGAPPVEVANTGVAGTGLEYSIGMLVNRVLPLEPDLCIFLHGHNAFFDSMREKWDPKAPPLPAPAPQFKDWLAGSSRLVALLEARKRARNSREDNKRWWYEGHRRERQVQFEKDGSKYTAPRFDVKRGIPHFKQQLHRLALLARDAGAVCAFMTQPVLYKDGTSAEEEAALQGVHIDGQNLDTPTLKYAMDAFNEAIRQVCREEGAILIDAAAEVPRDLQHFVDDVHLTSKGNEAVASSVLRAILGAKNELPRPAR